MLPAVHTPKPALGLDNVPLMVTLLPLLLSFPLVPTFPPEVLKEEGAETTPPATGRFPES